MPKARPRQQWVPLALAHDIAVRSNTGDHDEDELDLPPGAHQFITAGLCVFIDSAESLLRPRALKNYGFDYVVLGGAPIFFLKPEGYDKHNPYNVPLPMCNFRDLPDGPSEVVGSGLTLVQGPIRGQRVLFVSFGPELFSIILWCSIQQNWSHLATYRHDGDKIRVVIRPGCWNMSTAHFVGSHLTKTAALIRLYRLGTAKIAFQDDFSVDHVDADPFGPAIRVRAASFARRAAEARSAAARDTPVEALAEARSSKPVAAPPKHFVGPDQHAATPVQCTTAPVEHIRAPTHHVVAPIHYAASPVRHMTAPYQHLTTPVHATTATPQLVTPHKASRFFPAKPHEEKENTPVPRSAFDVQPLPFGPPGLAPTFNSSVAHAAPDFRPLYVPPQRRSSIGTTPPECYGIMHTPQAVQRAPPEYAPESDLGVAYPYPYVPGTDGPAPWVDPQKSRSGQKSATFPRKPPVSLTVARSAAREAVMRMPGLARERNKSLLENRTVLHDPFQVQNTPSTNSGTPVRQNKSPLRPDAPVFTTPNVQTARAPAMTPNSGAPPVYIKLPKPVAQPVTERILVTPGGTELDVLGSSAIEDSFPDTKWRSRPPEVIRNARPGIVGAYTKQNFDGPFFSDELLYPVPCTAPKTHEDRVNEWWGSGNNFTRQEAFHQSLSAVDQSTPAKLSTPANSKAMRPQIATPLLSRPKPAKNAEVIDLARLMIPMLENLQDYIEGPRDYWCRWVRAPEWCCDRSEEGNYSFIDKEWGNPPARIGRDPRYRDMPLYRW